MTDLMRYSASITSSVPKEIPKNRNHLQSLRGALDGGKCAAEGTVWHRLAGLPARVLDRVVSVSVSGHARSGLT
jgi:hypothetical protein